MKKMMKNLYEGLNAISIVSWILAIIMMMGVMYLEMNDITFKWVWNDISRSYTSESMMMTMVKFATAVVITAGSTNLVSSLLRRICEPKETLETIEEIEETES